MSSAEARKVRELAFRQELLLDAAERVFVERGFAGSSVEEIARRGGVALATLYKALPSKEAIFVRAIIRRLDDFVRLMRAASESGEPLARVEAAVRRTVEYFVQYSDTFRMYLAATHGFPWDIRSGLSDEVFAHYAGLIDHFEELCRAALPPSRQTAARIVALALIGATNAFLTDCFTRSRRRRFSAQEMSTELWSVVRALVELP